VIFHRCRQASYSAWSSRYRYPAENAISIHGCKLFSNRLLDAFEKHRADDLKGYNFKSLQHITPFLEPTTSGISSLWARTTALKYNCVVIVGYPEKVDISWKWPASPEYYNSSIVVRPAQWNAFFFIGGILLDCA